MTLDVYPWFAITSSIVLMLLFGHNAWHAARHRRAYHDDRSAYDLLLALTLFVASIGLAVSAIASFVVVAGVDATVRNEMRNVGLAIVRGVLIITAIVLLAGGRSGTRPEVPR